ncbi:MAG: 1-acyl-sn-glycerol-3-phosphate acyltransferase [bacterium]
MDDHKKLKPRHFFDGDAKKFVRGKVLRSDAGAAEGVYDPFGLDVETIVSTITFLLFMYRFYFRVEVHGIENIPDAGPGLIVSNHAPILPFDACMIGVAALVEPEHPRFVRTIINKTISSIPFASTLMSRSGQVIGCDENVRLIFENKNLMLVFPTGAEGRVHSVITHRYRLDTFPVGFMEYALRYRTPIIPACVTGSEESAMALGSIPLPRGGFRHFPITPIFPWLGPLGLIPFPSKFDIYFDPPVDYFTEHAHEVDNPAKVRPLVDGLHDRIQAMLDGALGR